MLGRRAFLAGLGCCVLADRSLASDGLRKASMGYQLVSRIDVSGAHPAPVVGGSGTPIGSPFLRAPGNVSYNNVVYDWSEEGLYRFANIGIGGTFDAGYRIVHQSNVERLMAALAHISSYGRSDESLTPAQVTTAARLRTVSMRCGKTIDWAQSICASLSVPFRTVRMITAETPNGFDDGHVACEVMVNGKWCLFDIPGDVAFRDPVSNDLMSMNEVWAAGVANVTTERIAPAQATPTDWSSTQFPTEAYFDLVFRFGGDAWRQRVYQCIGIDKPVNGQWQTWWKVPPGSPPSLTAYIEGLSSLWKVKSASLWDDTFYPS